MKKLRNRTVKKSRTSLPARKAVAAKGGTASNGNHLRVVFTEKQIKKRVTEMAAQVNRDAKGKTLHVIGILENCFLFMADLVRGDQQPVEAAAMVSACLDALRVSGDARWAGHARNAFDWFLGHNHLRMPLYDASTGGCR